jgi:acyl CoA:acetate/3-ketoacid CoA transferase beta subunit
LLAWAALGDGLPRALRIRSRGDGGHRRRRTHPRGGAGIGAFFTPTGAGTQFADSKEVRVFVAMEHTTRDGTLRIVRECSHPLIAVRCVDTIFTDVAVISVTPGGLVLEEMAPGWSVEDVQAITEPRLTVSPALRTVQV